MLRQRDQDQRITARPRHVLQDGPRHSTEEPLRVELGIVALAGMTRSRSRRPRRRPSLAGTLAKRSLLLVLHRDRVAKRRRDRQWHLRGLERVEPVPIADQEACRLALQAEHMKLIGGLNDSQERLDVELVADNHPFGNRPRQIEDLKSPGRAENGQPIMSPGPEDLVLAQFSKLGADRLDRCSRVFASQSFVGLIDEAAKIPRALPIAGKSFARR